MDSPLKGALVTGLLLIHHRVNNHMKQMCASKGWKEENLAQLEHDGNKARSQLSIVRFKGGERYTKFSLLNNLLGLQICFHEEMQILEVLRNPLLVEPWRNIHLL